MPAAAQMRYTFTKAWVLIASSVTIVRPFGTMRTGVILFLFTPFALVADIFRHRFAALLARKAKPTAPAP